MKLVGFGSLIFSIFFLFFSQLYCARLILSDENNKETSFPFNIKKHAFYIPTARFFVGSENPISNFAEFAIASATRFRNNFIPLAPQKVILNNKPDELNPLYGSAISNLSMFGRTLLATKKNDSRFFVIDDVTRTGTLEVFVSPIISDSLGLDAKEILSITSSAPELLAEPEKIIGHVAFAAVSNQFGSFNGNGSGIAAANLRLSHENERQTFLFQTADLQTGQKGNKAFGIDLDTSEIKIGGSLTNIGKIVDLFFDRGLNRLYVALDVEAGANADDGSRGILVCSGVLQEPEGDTIKKLELHEIAPESAFVSSEKIVGAIGSNSKVRIRKVRTMKTRTYLSYLIIVGGTNDVNFNKEVFSLPLVNIVNNTSDPVHGTLANVRIKPVDFFINGDPQSFITRSFLFSAKNPEDLFSSNDIQAQVGGGEVLPSDITDIQIVNDSVFVSVGQDGDALEAGIFYSQAIFDDSGVIKGWTRWKRVGGPDVREVEGFALDPLLGNFWFMAISNSVKKVLRTFWSQGDSDFEKIALQEFSPCEGGIRGVIDFPNDNFGLTQIDGNRFSFLALLGLNRVVLVQTGKDNELGIFGPVNISLDISRFQSSNGDLKNYKGEADLLSISGGELNNIGTLTSAAIVGDDTYGWFVVGGSDGLAILIRPDGTGWDINLGLGKNFEGLTSDMKFKKIGDFQQIKKISAIGNQLFVLTQKNLFRISISKNSNMSEMIEQVVLASNDDIGNCFSSFSDFLVTENLILLATSVGLFRSSKNTNILTTKNVVWQIIELPESAGSFCGQGPVTRLFTISPTGLEEDFVEGNIYLLNAYVGLQQAQVYRLTFNEQSGNVSVLLFPDLFVKNIRTFFVNLETYRNQLSTDGALILVSRSKYNEGGSQLFILPHRLKSGQRFGARESVIVPLNLNKFCSISGVIRVSASGSWLLYGDFGLRLNE